jgi:hypothetical protein
LGISALIRVICGSFVRVFLRALRVSVVNFSAGVVEFYKEDGHLSGIQLRQGSAATRNSPDDGRSFLRAAVGPSGAKETHAVRLYNVTHGPYGHAVFFFLCVLRGGFFLRGGDGGWNHLSVGFSSTVATSHSRAGFLFDVISSQVYDQSV